MKEAIKKLIPPHWIDAYHWLWSLAGALWYGFPAHSLTVIGVTGTNGKTTVTHLLSDMLEAAGFSVASVSSLRFKIGRREWVNDLKMTMPGRMRLQEFFATAKKAGVTHVVLEVTSEGIKHHRHAFIPFRGAILTNVTKEHLESHGGFEAYKAAKLKLFSALTRSAAENKFMVVNLNDPSANEFLVFPNATKYGYTIGSTVAAPRIDVKIFRAASILTYTDRTTFTLNDEEITMPLVGAFNVANALAAVCAASALGVSDAVIRSALKKFGGAPGRLEFVARNPFSVIVDYAHTPDALEKVYSALKTKSSELICVLGSAGGGRDKWKREELGAIAARFCKRIIVTNEDPYDENPVAIIEAVAEGAVREGKPVEKIIDRKEAIRKALLLAKKSDTVIITGKGAEPWMAIAKGKKVPWDDRLIVKQQLAKLKLEEKK